MPSRVAFPAQRHHVLWTLESLSVVVNVVRITGIIPAKALVQVAPNRSQSDLMPVLGLEIFSVWHFTEREDADRAAT